MSKLKAIFLDRDGIINHDTVDVKNLDEFEIVDGFFQTMKTITKNNQFVFFFVSNQSGIGRGVIQQEDFDEISNFIEYLFDQYGLDFGMVKHCPHKSNEGCACRKPNTGMIDEILVDYDIDLENSWLVGDKWSDIELAKNVGVGKSVYVENGYEYKSNIKPDFTIRKITELKDIIK
jgi:D-glycero-D-manno-heptose 1,7-bisphosphate phosphatase